MERGEELKMEGMGVGGAETGGRGRRRKREREREREREAEKKIKICKAVNNAKECNSNTFYRAHYATSLGFLIGSVTYLLPGLSVCR